MHRIYGRAHCTIIATGDNADYGLPGVGQRKRNQQKQYNFGHLKLTELVHLSAQFASSSWATRAWTYQEGYLSRRRLIFTDDGIIFLCNEMHCWETVFRKGLNGTGESSVEIVDHHTYRSMFPGFRARQNHMTYHTQMHLLMNYCERTLTFEQDALEACLGVFSAMDVTHYWGIQIRRIRQGLTGFFTMDLFWQNAIPAVRRPQFPTWSWTSCTGSKMFDFREKTTLMCRIELNLAGQWVDVADLARYSKGNFTDMSPSKTLRVTGPTLKPTWALQQNGEVHMSLPFAPGNIFDVITVHFDLADRSLTTSDDLLALIIEIPNRLYDRLVLLLIEPHGAHYRRLGVAQGRTVHFEREDRGFIFTSSWIQHSVIRTLLLE